MRIRRLDLIRYGRFTNSSLKLPKGEPDLHIVLGPNEAGKSTVRSAVGDLLFGIPARSALNFLHDYGSMRIGAALESEAGVLEVRRRKGSRDTLLADDDTRLPAGEQALGPFLHGADRKFFERMFSLDHQLLRVGGREILQGDSDDVGQKLFAAGSGIQDLQIRLVKLEDEAAKLWTKRRAAGRSYYVAEDKLKEAESQKREHTVSADLWQDLRRAYDRSKQEHDRLDTQIRQSERELRKIARIRRLARHIVKKSSLEGEIRGLGAVAELPEGSAERLREAEEQGRETAVLLEQRHSDFEQAKADRATIRWDKALLRREGEIESLHQQRIQIKKGITDLPGLNRKLGEEQATLVEMAAECGWSGVGAGPVANRIPSRSELESMRSMLADWREKRAQVESADTAAKEATSRLERIGNELEAIGMPQDMRDLAALVAATRKEHGAIGSQVAKAEAEAVEARAEVERLYAGMDPLPASVEVAVRLATPSEAVVREWHDRHRDLRQQLRDQRERLASQRKELASSTASVNQLVAERKPVTLEDVLAARQSRDTRWTALRKRFIDDDGSSGDGEIELEKDPQQAADLYQEAVARADQLGDLRSDMAESNARVAEARRRAATVSSELAGIKTELERLEQRDREMDAEWGALWKGLPFEPHGPDQMLAWLTTRDRLGEAASRSARADRQLAALRDREAQVVQGLARELGRLGEDCTRLEQGRLAMVLERADQAYAANERMADARQRLERELRQAAHHDEAKRSLLRGERSHLQQLEREWAAFAAKLGVDPEASPGEATGLLATLDRMREVASRISDLRSDRIEKIERDIQRFSAEVKALAQAVAPQLAEQDPSEAMVELESRLESAESARAEATSKDTEIESIEGRIRELEAKRRTSERVIEDLQAQAGATDIDGLWDQIRKAEKLRSLRQSLASLTDAVLQDGDDLPMDSLVEECSGVDMEEIVEREESLESSTKDLRSEFLTARDHLREAKAAFDGVGGSDAAAMAEGARQGALAEIQEIAEQFIQVRAAACLLRWAIERYRSERQGPMLRRAGELFSMLTLGSFQHLEVDYNEQDQAQIVGCRQSGERVPTSGMSDGSSDQLYLALRVAALEDYLQESPQMPFVADDLFINFDDMRAAAGFKVLAGLAQLCQVIFFTHHQHLAELAQESLDFPVQVLRIES